MSCRARLQPFQQARPFRASVRATSAKNVCSAQAVKHQQLQKQLYTATAAAALSFAMLVLIPEQSIAKMAPVNQEVDNASSPVIQAMLKRTEEMKEQRYKERLADYYRRNFREYFDFEGGNVRAGTARGLSPETQQEILKWLEENK